METMELDNDAAWAALFGPGRPALGAALQAAGPAAPLALRAAWLIEVERLPHEADRLLQREPLADAALRALLAAAAALMYDDAPAALRHAEAALQAYADPLQPLHGWAALLQGQAQLELGWPARARAPLQTALRIAHRDGLSLLQLDALRGLARLHDEAGEPGERDAVLASAAPLIAVQPQLAASDSLRRLQAQLAAREALLGGDWPALPAGDGLGHRLARAWQAWLRGEPTVQQEVAALRTLQRQQYWPLKWQVELAQLEGGVAASMGRAACTAILAADVAPCLALLQAQVLAAGHARLAGRPIERQTALAEELHTRGLLRLASRLALVQAQDAAALSAWWQRAGRDAVDAVWLAPCLLPLWPAVLARPEARRSALDQRALQALGEQLNRAGPAAGSGPPAELTAREWQVLQLIGEDWSNAQIAAQLFVAETTVKTHINRVYAKLGIADRAAARLKARLLGA